MGMDLRISTEPERLLIVATGEFSLEEAKRTFLEVLNAMARHKLEKVLFDARELRGEPETMERFFYGEFAAAEVLKSTECGWFRAPRFAYVLRDPVLDRNRFGENVAVNRGMVVKTFENVEDALGWL